MEEPSLLLSKNLNNLTNESYISNINGIRHMSTKKRLEIERERNKSLKNEEFQKIEKEMEIIYRILDEEEGIEDDHRSASYFAKLFLQEFTIALTTVTSKKYFNCSHWIVHRVLRKPKSFV